jgi:hypothetical protein
MRFLMRSAAGLAALAMTLGSTANAAATSVQAVDPLVAVSLFGSAQSARVVCNPEAAGQSGTAAGCVHQAAYAAQDPAPAANSYYDSQSVGGGIGILPVVAGLAAIAIVAVLLLNDDDDGRIDLPVSP